MKRGSLAPGHPGIEPRWTSSAKSGVGTALDSHSRVWFSLSHGILDEVYYPRVDQACTRDLGLIVTDGADYFSEEKRHASHEVAYLAPGVPAFRLTNTCSQGRYRIEKEVISDPQRDVVLQSVCFEALQGDLDDYHLYVLLAPHLGNRGAHNTAWLGEYKGRPMLMAEGNGCALALASSAPWLARSAGFVGATDGWQDLHEHKRMTWSYERAEDGNVALTGEIDLGACGGEFVLSLGFGLNTAEAGYRALASLRDDFEGLRHSYVKAWQRWQEGLKDLDSDSGPANHYRVSAAVMRTHEAKRFPGGIIASLSVPWGFARGDDDLGGYHLAWPRDLAEAAGGLLAAGAGDDVLRVLDYLQLTQEADGHWPQNMWLDGRAFWTGIQMDETALPLLLVDLARRQGLLEDERLYAFWPMVRAAASFIVCNGPVSPEDRWEEDPGYSPFTLAVEIAALLAAADLAEARDEGEIAAYLRQTADAWNAEIERWTYVSNTDLAEQSGVDGYYVRIAPPESEVEASTPTEGYVPIKNRPPGNSKAPASQIVSPDALALVRFGLRAADDPRILNTIQVIDRLLRVETPQGPAWHRYNEDGYGEHEDGSPFDGSGVGRAWPLLTGERAHYALAAGDRAGAQRLREAMEGFASASGLISEQVWDSEDLPEYELFCGRPSGSAMPLVWAHAEYVKLLRSLQEGHVFDMPPQTRQRYQEKPVAATVACWRFNHKRHTLPAGLKLRVETLAPARVHWSDDGWQSRHDLDTHDTGLGIHLADLPTADLAPGERVQFTFYWPQEDRWEESDFTVEVANE